jgi:hypothetical protein
LPQQRWRADPPLIARPKPAVRPSAPRPYFGPPSYRGGHPAWGFPPVVWRRANVSAPEQLTAAPLGRLLLAVYLCTLTGLAALAAAGGEMWRYALMLRGRTEVLSGPTVVASDRLVALASLTAVVLGMVAAVVTVPLLVRLHRLAAVRVGLEPSRTSASVVARLVVPGWNVFGVGVVAGEIDGLLSAPHSGRRPRMSGLVIAWWAAWIVNAVLVLITLVKAFGTSDQAVADTVELHIFVDLTAAAVALLAGLVLRRFRVLLRGPGVGRHSTWIVGPPESTRGLQAASAGQPGPADRTPEIQPSSSTTPPAATGRDQLPMLKTAPGNATAGPEANQTTVSASASGDQPDAAAEPDPTTATPIP